MPRVPLRSLLPCVAGAALLAAPAAIAAPIGSTTLIDRPSGDAALPPDDLNFSLLQSSEALSADGNRLVFESLADGLHLPDGDRHLRYVYLRDRAAGTTTNVCRATGKGSLANASCNQASISRNGRYVTFTSAATNLTSGVAGGVSRLYRRDLQTGVTELVSRANGSVGAAAEVVGRGSVADDGTVVFATAAALSPADSGNARSDVYTRSGTTTTLISRIGAGAVGNGGSESPVISGDGSTVAFTSDATNFSGNDANVASDIYTAPAAGGSTPTLESRKAAAAGNGPSDSPVLSQDGRFLALVTAATDLFSSPIATDTGGHRDVIRRDRNTGTNVVISITPAQVQANDDAYAPTIAPDGSSVAYGTGATNLGATTHAGEGGLGVIRNPSANTTVIATRTGAAGSPVASGLVDGISSAAGRVALNATGVPGYAGQTLVYFADIAGGSLELASRPTGSGAGKPGASYSDVLGSHSVSADGRFVVFQSDSVGLVPDAVDGQTHIYVRDQWLGTTTLIDRAGGPSGPPSAGRWAEEPVISSDGRTVAYLANAGDILPEGADDDGHIYVVTLASGAVQLGDRSSTGTLAGSISESGMSLSADGRMLAFGTGAALDPADTNGKGDVYVRDLVTGQTQLASRADGSAGPVGSGDAYGSMLSGDGKRVGFTSENKLDAADTNGKEDAYVRDLASGQTLLVSRADGAAGAPGDDGSSIGDLSADGSKVAFRSVAGNLGDGATAAHVEVHVRDLAAATTVWASRPDGGAQNDADASGGSLSDDGTRIAFTSESTKMQAADANGYLDDAYVRDLSTGALTRVSVADGAAGAQADDEVRTVAISANGRCAVFSTQSIGLVPGGYASPDFQHVYERAFGGECPVPVPDIVPPSSGGTSGPTGPVAAKDITAPALTKLSLSRKAFGTKGKKKGTTISFSLSEAATVKIAIAKTSKGKKKGKACVAPAKAKKKAKACELLATPKALRTITGKLGRNQIAFDGKLGKKALKRGTYRFMLTATDAAGNHSATSITFTVR